jgi:hypothetical protein
MRSRYPTPPRPQLTRAERGNPDGIRPGRAGKPTARKAQLPSGHRMTRKPMPVAERQRETRDKVGGPSAARPAITGRIRASARTRKGADVAR